MRQRITLFLCALVVSGGAHAGGPVFTTGNVENQTTNPDFLLTDTDGEDWAIEADEPVADAFSIARGGGATPVLVIENGARTNALYIDSDGDIGIGTSTPAVDVQVRTGNTPTHRLEQDGSSGFTPQTWDVAGNEAQFFIRDVTNGSSLPFRIQTGAPDSAINIAADGSVGVGTGSPDNDMELFRSSGTALIEVEAAGNAATGNQAGFAFINGTTTPGTHRWDARIGGVGNLIFNYNSGPSEFTYTTGGNLNLAGVVNQGSSRGVKRDVAAVDPAEILNKVVNLDISEWSYIKEPGVRHVGPMAEDFAERFELGGDPTRLAALDTSGVALAAIQGLHRQLQQKDAKIAQMEKDLAELKDMEQELAELKAAVHRLAAKDQTAALQ